MRAGVVVLLAAVGCGGGKAPATSAVEPTPAPPPEPEVMGPGFWEIRQGDAVSWLFAETPLLPIPPVVLERLREARQVVLEYDEPTLLARHRETMFVRDEGSLSEQLGEQAWGDLLIEMPLHPAEQLDRLRPGAVEMMLLHPTIDGAEEGGSLGMLARRATALHKPVSFLVANEQLDDYVRAWLPPLDDPAQLKRALADVAARRADRLAEAEAARRGDLDLLDPDRRPTLERDIYRQFNQQWLDQLRPMLVSGGLFVAISVNHMAGKHGIPALLGRTGLQVTRIRTVTRAPEPLRPAVSEQDCEELYRRSVALALEEEDKEGTVDLDEVLEMSQGTKQRRMMLAACRRATRAQFECMMSADKVAAIERCE